LAAEWCILDRDAKPLEARTDKDFEVSTQGEHRRVAALACR
jgi:hypothetical protein